MVYLVSLSLLLLGCGPPREVAKVVPGTPLSHDFPAQTVAAGEERLGECRSWTLHNDEEVWVNAVELVQTESSHHTNFVFVPDDRYPGPDGIWTCADRAYEFYTAISAGGVLFAQPTQSAADTQRFAPGSAIRLPPYTRIVSDIHLLNAGSRPVTGQAQLTLYTLAAAEVSVKLKAFHVEYDALDIPPQTNARFTATCRIASDFAATTGRTFAPKLHYLMPHTHTLATGFFAGVLGGARDGATLLDATTYDTINRGRSFDPPFDMGDADGFVFGCQYANPRAERVTWGFGRGEMCELFGFADTAAFFQSRVKTGAPAGEDGVVQLFTGTCENVVFRPGT
jgi:hypothetical protein